MNRAQIRCCCDPGRLLGTVPIPAESLVIGSVIRFALLSDQDSSSYADDVGFAAAETLELPVADWSKTTYDPETKQPPIIEMGVAIRSNDTPIERLRRIRGFVEAES